MLPLFSLIRIALSGKAEAIPMDTDWNAVIEYAELQGVDGIVFDALEVLKKAITNKELENCSYPDIYTFLEWLGPVNQMVIEYEQRMKVAKRLASLCAQQNIDVVLLKGYSIAQFYPDPRHRYSCDLDIFIAEGWDRACKMLEDRGIELVHEVYKEVEFTVDRVYVECHRYITPFRGHKQLRKCELYLRSELNKDNTKSEEFGFIIPPLSFITMHFMEHALGDLLHGELKLRNIIDWIVLRRQQFDRKAFDAHCKEFGFDRCVSLIDSLADVIEGKKDASELSPHDKEIFDSLLKVENKEPESETWFQRRVATFWSIVHNRKYYNRYGFCSMPVFMFNSLWTHFVKKKVTI